MASPSLHVINHPQNICGQGHTTCFKLWIPFLFLEREKLRLSNVTCTLITVNINPCMQVMSGPTKGFPTSYGYDFLQAKCLFRLPSQ